MTVKVYKLSDDSLCGICRSVYETNRATNVIVKDGFFVIEVGSGFIHKFSSEIYGCYVVA